MSSLCLAVIAIVSETYKIRKTLLLPWMHRYTFSLYWSYHSHLLKATHGTIFMVTMWLRISQGDAVAHQGLSNTLEQYQSLSETNSEIHWEDYQWFDIFPGVN